MRIENKGRNLWSSECVCLEVYTWGQGTLVKDSWYGVTVLSYNPLVFQISANFRGVGMWIDAPSGSHVYMSARNIGYNNFYIRLTAREDIITAETTPTASGQFTYKAQAVAPGNTATISLDVPDNCQGVIAAVDGDLTNAPDGIIKATDIIVTIEEPIIEYTPARSDSLDLPVSAFGYAGVYDEITSDGTKVKRWEQEIILPSTHTIDLYPWYTHLMLQYHYHLLRVYLSKEHVGDYSANVIATHYDGVPLTPRTSQMQGPEMVFLHHTSGSPDAILYIATFRTGFDEAYIPSSNEVQAYFNGWKVNGYSITGSVTDEATGLLADQDTYTFANAGKYKNLTVTKSSDDVEYTTAEPGVDYELSNLNTTAVLKNISGSSLYFKISYDYGVTANSWVGLDGTTPSENTLSYVSSTTLRDQNPDTWWKPYVIIYQLADPEVEQVDISGSLDLYADYNYIVTDQLIPVAMEFQVDEDDVEYKEDGTLRTLDGKVLAVVDKYQGINNSTAYILEHAITNLLGNPTIHMWTKSGVTSELRDEKYRGYVVHRLTFSADSTGYIQQTFPVNSAVTHTGAIFYRFVQSSDADLNLALDDTTQQIPVSYDWNRISVSKTYSETGTGTFKISKSATSTNDIIIDVACPIVDAVSFVPEYTQTSRDNGILTLQTDTNAQDDWILDFWLKFKYINSDQIIFQFGNIVFGYSTSSGFYLTIGSETNSSTYSISADEWLHIVVQKSNQAFLVSVNDEAIISSEYDTSATGSTELIFASDNTKQPDMVVSLIILK